jgi:predicted membrane protein
VRVERVRRREHIDLAVRILLAAVAGYAICWGVIALFPRGAELHWFYVLGRLMGTTCIATRLIFVVEIRKKQRAKINCQSSRVVRTMVATTTCTG